MRKILSFVLSAIMVLSIFAAFPLEILAAENDLLTVKIDFGGEGTAPGYLGVTASDKYDSKKGYGFVDPTAVANVSASGTGAYADAINFSYRDANHIFNYDLPNGLYKLTVTTGDVTSICISAEGAIQLTFLTGNCTTESFVIPITDGQLNFYATSGYPGTPFSVSALEIEQISTDPTMKPTIWLFGDSTVANYYNISDSATHGWGQVLDKYIDSSAYDVRNISASGWRTNDFIRNDFMKAALNYGDSDDICVIALGINDYTDAYNKNTGKADPTTYVSNLTTMVSNAKAKGMKVYIVKQPWSIDDIKKYPILDKQWFSDEIDQVAAAQGANVIDLFTPWRDICLAAPNANVYYSTGVHQNAAGSEILAQMVAEQLFPSESQGGSGNTIAPIDTAGTVVYETSESGEVITNPHKGYVMNVYEPRLFGPSNPKGIGGSDNNQAWNVVTICSGVYFWKDLNPKKGEYDWSAIDAMLEECAARGMTYGIRIQPFTTGKGSHENFGADHDMVPQWVYDSGCPHVDAKFTENGVTWPIKVPDWSNATYIKAYKDFVTAMAEHYDGDPRVEYVEIRSFGNFGEWHTSGLVGSSMPSEDIQIDMLNHYASVFHSTTCCLLANTTGSVYEEAIKLGFAKRNNGLIMTPNEEWNLVPAYMANLPTMGDYHHSYAYMLNSPSGYLNWTPEHFKEVIEIGHLSILSLDMDSTFGYQIYREQKPTIDEMVNRMGYNFTVTSARRYRNKLQVTIENTGLASCFFDFNLCAEITDSNGNKIADFGQPILITKGSFRDGTSQIFEFEYSGTLPGDANICLGMYECDNPYIDSTNPNVRFDNKNNLSNKRLLLVPGYVIEGEVAPTATPIPTTKPMPTATATPKPTAIPKPTATATHKPTTTPKPTATAAPKPTATPVPTVTVAPKPTVTPAPTVTTTSKPTATPKPTATVAPKPTATPVPAATVVPKPTVTPAPTATATPKPTATATPKPTATPTPTEIPEKTETVEDFAERLYTTCLGRAAEKEGKDYWVSELKAGKTGAVVAEGFFFSEEFEGFELTNEEYIERLYLTFMGREPDQEGMDYWKSEMKSGKDRKFIFDGFVNSTEWADICLTYGIRSGGTAKPCFEKEASDDVIAFAERLYTTCLCREAEDEGLKYWSQELANLRITGTEAAHGFFFSNEFEGLRLSDKEYVTRLYRTFMGREPEAEGFNFWISELKSGKSRQYIFDGFSNAQEFAEICAEAGIIR